VAKAVIDAVEQGKDEVLADPFTEQVKATLSEPVDAMEKLMDRARTARLQSGSPKP
jgi:hypothetical protein